LTCAILRPLELNSLNSVYNFSPLLSQCMTILSSVQSKLVIVKRLVGEWSRNVTISRSRLNS
jgi:hypothetical protein